MKKQKNLGIYFHWPFCRSKCPYCDFYKEIHRDENQENIINSYIEDLNFYKNYIDSQRVSSIFFGGGTPSLVKPELIEKLINHIYKNFSLASDIEISLEANPNTNRQHLFSDLKNAGINRLSLGIQSFDDSELKFLGRTHNSEQAKQAADEVLKIFDNHSIDLMYALPFQTTDSWMRNLNHCLSLGFKHLSLYQLTIEDGTVFAKKGIKPLPDEEASKLYLMTENILKTAEYLKYEVSNFAQKGFECRHNLLYWQGDDYIGIGKSAHGRIGLKATEHHRLIYELTKEERAQELIIMGLRLKQGIEKKKFFNICGIMFDDFINRKFFEMAIKDKLLINNRSHVCASLKGELVLNYLIEHLCP